MQQNVNGAHFCAHMVVSGGLAKIHENGTTKKTVMPTSANPNVVTRVLTNACESIWHSVDGQSLHATATHASWVDTTTSGRQVTREHTNSDRTAHRRPTKIGQQIAHISHQWAHDSTIIGRKGVVTVSVRLTRVTGDTCTMAADMMM